MDETIGITQQLEHEKSVEDLRPGTWSKHHNSLAKTASFPAIPSRSELSPNSWFLPWSYQLPTQLTTLPAQTMPVPERDQLHIQYLIPDGTLFSTFPARFLAIGNCQLHIIIYNATQPASSSQRKTRPRRSSTSIYPSRICKPVPALSHNALLK